MRTQNLFSARPFVTATAAVLAVFLIVPLYAQAADSFVGPVEIGTSAITIVSGDNATSTFTNGIDLPEGGCFAVMGVCVNQFWNFVSGIFIGVNDTAYNTPVAVGHQALLAYQGGNSNTAIGNQTLWTMTSGNDNIGLGQAAGNGFETGDANTFLGNATGQQATPSGRWSGNKNVFIGSNVASSIADTSAIDHSTFIGGDTVNFQVIGTGSYNMVLGAGVNLPDPNGSYQLNIGNLIYGTDVSGTQYAISPGRIGIGTSNPSARFSIQANNGETNSLLFSIASDNGTTNHAYFTVDNLGHVVYDGAKPTVSSCGTGATVSGNDARGRIHVGAGTVTSCTITFVNAWDKAPVCIVNKDTGTLLMIAANSSKTNFVVRSSVSMGGEAVSYSCDGF